MLYALCKQYLIDKLKEAGIKTRPYTTRKALEKCMESQINADGVSQLCGVDQRLTAGLRCTNGGFPAGFR